MMKKLLADPIIDEAHRTRREVAAQFGGDFGAMLEDAPRRQEAPGRPRRASR